MGRTKVSGDTTDVISEICATSSRAAILGRMFLPKPVAPVAVTIGGQAATVQYAGQAPNTVAGVMQINAQIPNGTQAGNGVPVVVQVGSVSTQPGVTVAVGN